MVQWQHYCSLMERTMREQRLCPPGMVSHVILKRSLIQSKEGVVGYASPVTYASTLSKGGFSFNLTYGDELVPLRHLALF